MTIRRLSSCLPILVLILSPIIPIAAFADPPQGRPVVQVPIGPNVTQASAGDASANGVLYETHRIKRTVVLDPAAGIDGRWDPLYSVQDGSGGARTTYLDWDDRFLYIAVETPNPAEVRIDIDGQNDGWLRGPDNLSLDMTPPADGGATPPVLVAQRFDMAQNKEQPVWAASPIPVGDIQIAGGRTGRGTYAIMLAIPHTESIGLALKDGSPFGIRVDSGNPKLPPAAMEAISIPVRPMLRVVLSETVAAYAGGLGVTISVNGAHDITPGGSVKTTVEIRNDGSEVRRVTRMFIRGSLNDSDFVDEGKFAGTDVPPGKSIKRDLDSTVAPAAPVGALVMSGGADLEDGTTVASLVSFNKVEPYFVYAETDGKPIPAGGDNGKDPVRTVKVFVRSRVNNRVSATVHVKLPDGWKDVSDPREGNLKLVRDGDVEFSTFKFSVPSTAALGAHTIGATVDVAGKTYAASTTVVIAQ